MKGVLVTLLSFMILVSPSLHAQISPSIQWQKLIGGSNYEGTQTIIPTKDGGTVMAAQTASNNSFVLGNHGQSDIWVVKLDPGGNLAWSKCLGGSGAEGLSGNKSIIQTYDNGYIVAGYTASNDGDVTGRHDSVTGSPDCWIIKLDSVTKFGTPLCNCNIPQPEFTILILAILTTSPTQALYLMFP